MNLIVQLPDGRFQKVDAHMPEVHVNEYGQHFYMLSFVIDEKMYEAIIEKVNGEWAITKYISSKFVEIAWGIKKELEEKTTFVALADTSKKPVSTMHLPEDLEANKKQLIEFLDFIGNWYPYEDEGVVSLVDSVRRAVFNSSAKWPVEQLRSLIPTGDNHGVLDLNDLQDRDNIFLILNRILKHLHANMNDAIDLTIPSHYYIAYPNYRDSDNSFKKTSPISNKPLRERSNIRRNYFVTFFEDIISDAVQDKEPRDIYKKIKIYICNDQEYRCFGERLPISSETLLANFTPEFVRDYKLFIKELKEYLKRVRKFEQTFGQRFFPPLEIAAGNHVDVYHISQCNNKRQFEVMSGEDSHNFEVYYSSCDYGGDDEKGTIDIHTLLNDAVSGKIRMTVFSGDNDNVESFGGADVGAKTPTGRHT